MRLFKSLLATRSLFSGATSPSGERIGRTVVFLVVLTVHLLVVLWLASHHLSDGFKRQATLNVFSVPLPGEGKARVHPVQKKSELPASPVPTLPIPSQSPTVGAASTLSGATAIPGVYSAADGCMLPQAIGQAIGQDAAAMAEIDALPPDVRTSADAVLLWNGQWLDLGATPVDSNKGSLRRVVEGIVAGTPSECRIVEEKGPQFIPVPEGDRTVMIVIGSGAWRWEDMISTPETGPAPLPYFSPNRANEN